jgi:hypothetical protein
MRLIVMLIVMRLMTRRLRQRQVDRQLRRAFRGRLSEMGRQVVVATGHVVELSRICARRKLRVVSCRLSVEVSRGEQ